ncbi:MAG: tRNA epoxyqueuosine(34) reductase QueG [Ignavibacteriales bacterium]|nr:MAG: tRNA epoxyqueuosine(34) reductase QueG [Ignavibacteriales bacterium]
MITNQTVIDIAHSLGFDLVGFAKVEPLSSEIQKLKQWLEKDFHADMSYMARNFNKREDPSQIFSDVKSVISLGLNYNTPFTHNTKSDKEKNKLPAGKVSRYAWGKDYHLIIWEKLKLLETKLKEIDNSFNSISYVDTGPVMDKAWAVRAGLGWLGKHTNVINRNIGSWFFIATIFTNKDFTYSEIITDFCGSCTACLDACPTGAIVKEYVVDSNKCISYLTIENKNEIPTEYKGKFDDWIFGCDICQDVCPWNEKFSITSSIKDFEPKDGKTSLTMNEVKDMNDEEFKIRFSESPIKRTKLKGLKRNAEFLEE